MNRLHRRMERVHADRQYTLNPPELWKVRRRHRSMTCCTVAPVS
jgi:hypothetical protein